MSHRRLLFATLAVVCLMGAPGCGNSVQKKIVGTWILDLDATKAMAHFQAMPEKQRAALYKNLDGMAMEVEFTATTMTKTSSAVVMEGLDRMKEIVTGTYKVNRSRGSTLVWLPALSSSA